MAPRRPDRVHAHGHRRRRATRSAEGGGDRCARLVLGRRDDRVLEVEHDLVRLQRRGPWRASPRARRGRPGRHDGASQAGTLAERAGAGQGRHRGATRRLACGRMTAERDLDVVVYGATGFVGRLTARYLAEHAPEGARIGARGAQRGEARRSCAPSWARAPPTGRCSSPTAADPAALAAMAARDARHRHHRRALRSVRLPARAGVRGGGDALRRPDRRGAVHPRQSIDRFDEPARESGARIVHSCGFDSIPSDLGVLALHERRRRDGAGELEDTTLRGRAVSGGISGGTLDSMRGQLDAMKRDQALRRLPATPTRSAPTAPPSPTSARSATCVDSSATPSSGWLAPFMMAGDQHARRAPQQRAAAATPTGRRFRYREVMSGGPGLLGPGEGRRGRRRARRARGRAGAAARRARCSTACCPIPARARARRRAQRASTRSTIHAATSAGAATRRASRSRATRATPPPR